MFSQAAFLGITLDSFWTMSHCFTDSSWLSYLKLYITVYPITTVHVIILLVDSYMGETLIYSYSSPFLIFQCHVQGHSMSGPPCFISTLQIPTLHIQLSCQSKLLAIRITDLCIAVYWESYWSDCFWRAEDDLHSSLYSSINIMPGPLWGLNNKLLLQKGMERVYPAFIE